MEHSINHWSNLFLQRESFLQSRQHLIGMPLWADIFPYLLNMALGINQKSCAECGHEFLTVEFTLTPQTELVQIDMPYICQEWKVQSMFISKLIVRVDIVWADAIDSNAFFLKLWDSITEPLSLNRSTASVVFWIDKQHISCALQSLA